MPPAHRNKNYKNCDETFKKRGELATGAFFEPKKRRWKSPSRNSKIKDDETVANPGRGAAAVCDRRGAGAFQVDSSTSTTASQICTTPVATSRVMGMTVRKRAL